MTLSKDNKPQLYVLGILSGCLWGSLGYFVGHEHTNGNSIWGGVAASPLIGYLIALISAQFNKFGFLAKLFISLASLYIAVILFGFAVGVYDLIWTNAPNRLPLEVIVQSILACLWWVTFGGFIFLWPLTYINHWMLAKKA